MTGRILEFSLATNTGLIRGDNGARYSFAATEWKSDTLPTPGLHVDFQVDGSRATDVFRTPNDDVSTSRTDSKSKLAAGLLALFLGWLGIHKFYLGYTGPGLLFLLTNTIGWVVTWALLGLPNAILGIIALIEGILYLTMTDEEFIRKHIEGRHPWF
jgi:TM2 domain-containing membrane protein YozV